MFCCKPPASGKKIDLKDFEDKFEYDGEFEAPALEQKLPIEKQKLVIDAWKHFQELLVKNKIIFLFSFNGDNLHWLFVWLGKACSVILEIAYKFCGMVIVYVSLI